jgi:hypothetical protein
MAEERSYNLVVFGDEVPGVLAAVAAPREQRRRGRPPQVLLLSPGPEPDRLTRPRRGLPGGFSAWRARSIGLRRQITNCWPSSSTRLEGRR